MQPTTISVTFRKQISDGNFGSEVAEVTLQAPVDEGADYRLDVAAALSHARMAVQSELRQSPSIAVRRALEPQAPRQTHTDEL